MRLERELAAKSLGREQLGGADSYHGNADSLCDEESFKSLICSIFSSTFCL